MTIRITYVQDGRPKRATIDGTTTQDAVRWMAHNKPGVFVFRASIMRNVRITRPRFSGYMVAADETGTGAHRPVRR